MPKRIRKMSDTPSSGAPECPVCHSNVAVKVREGAPPECINCHITF